MSDSFFSKQLRSAPPRSERGGGLFIDALESRRLLSGGPVVTSFKIAPRSPTLQTGSVSFIVKYTGTVGINPTTFDDRDLRVTGPNDYVRYARATDSTSNGDGSVREVRYKISPPGGSWNSGDDGLYAVRLQGHAVSDSSGGFNDVTKLGTFRVDIAAAFRATVINHAEHKPQALVAGIESLS